MELLNKIVQGFIMSFGITQPTPGKRKSAFLFVGLLLLAVAGGFLTLVFFLITHFFR